MQHAKAKGKLDALKEAARSSVAGSRAAGRLEEDLWLCPLEDRHRQDGCRKGMLEGFSLGSYLLLVDYTSRLCCRGKARVSAAVAAVFERLGTNADVWGQRIQHLLSKGRLLGNFSTTDRQRLRELAAQRGVHHLDNLAASTV